MTTSFTFGEAPAAPSKAIIDELLTYEVAWVSDAVGLYLMDSQIRPIHGRVGRIAGPAVTVTTPPGDFLMGMAALRTVRPGDVLVVDARGDTSRAVWGDYFTKLARDLGVAGVVIDGAARDPAGIEDLAYPVFARGTTPRKPLLAGPGEINVPVSCGGVCVVPGDIILGDSDGVIVVPRRHLESILERARLTAERERQYTEEPAYTPDSYEAWFQKVFAKRIADAAPLGYDG